MARLLPMLLLVQAAAIGRAQEPTTRATDALPAPTFVRSSRIVVSPQVDAGTPVERIELWSSRDGRRSWRLATTTTDSRRVEYEAPEDGRYELYLRLINEAGASADAPTAGAAPTASVIVDTIPPLLQLHEARAALDDAGETVLSLRLSIFDENLGPAGLRLFFRAAGTATWHDGGPLQPGRERAECWSGGARY